jgi:hypothetical protein
VKVYIVSLEWNAPPAEVTGDPGLVGAYARKAQADRAAEVERQRLDKEGQQVYAYSMRAGRYCGACGEDDRVPGAHALCSDTSEPEFCDRCGAEYTEIGTCDNDHDEWTIDVHVSELEVQS